MKTLIHINTICEHYQLEKSEIETFHTYGLITVEHQDGDAHMLEEELARLEKVLRFQRELDINLEGIDVIFSLLTRIEELEKENLSLKNKLHITS